MNGIYIEGDIRAFAQTHDALGILVRGHLFLEQASDEILARSFHRPLDVRLDFDAKVSLAWSLGAIDDNERKFINQVNNCRNKAAHRRNYPIDKELERNLWRSYVTSAGFSNDRADLVFPQRLWIMLLGMHFRLLRRAYFVNKTAGAIDLMANDSDEKSNRAMEMIQSNIVLMQIQEKGMLYNDKYTVPWRGGLVELNLVVDIDNDG